MDDWHQLDIVTEARRQRHTAYVTAEGAAWLASASAFPRSVQALWAARPTTPSVLPCGSAFDVVNLAALFGRRVLLFVAPGTAHRLPALLDWEEWGSSVPPMLCHGSGDAVTVPPLYGPETGTFSDCGAPRWVVAPDTRHPWLPGADHLLWACVRAARATPRKSAAPQVSPPSTA